MRKLPLLLCVAILVLSACVPKRAPQADVTIEPGSAEPSTSPANAAAGTSSSDEAWVPAGMTPQVKTAQTPTIKVSPAVKPTEAKPTEVKPTEVTPEIKPVAVKPVEVKPIESSSASATPATPAAPDRGPVSMKMSSTFKLDMPFDTATQLKLPAKVSGEFSIDVKSKSVATTPDRSTYTCEYVIILREVTGARPLGNWSGTLNGEEDGVPAEVVDRAFKRFSTGTEILRRVVAPQ